MCWACSFTLGFSRARILSSEVPPVPVCGARILSSEVSPVPVCGARILSSECGAAFQEDDIIVLNGTKEDVELLKKRMEERRLRAKLEKRTKKPKTAECVSKAGVADDSAGPSKVKAGKPEEADPDHREKKSNLASRDTATNGKAGKAPCGSLKRSIANSDESETYKSIFTSHSSAKRSKEESAHWVTHTSYCF
ncbi:hypothetical protein ACRRTK_013158 [Alexandromys fortis]